MPEQWHLMPAAALARDGRRYFVAHAATAVLDVIDLRAPQSMWLVTTSAVF